MILLCPVWYSSIQSTVRTRSYKIVPRWKTAGKFVLCPHVTQPWIVGFWYINASVDRGSRGMVEIDFRSNPNCNLKLSSQHAQRLLSKVHKMLNLKYWLSHTAWLAPRFLQGWGIKSNIIGLDFRPQSRLSRLRLEMEQCVWNLKECRELRWSIYVLPKFGLVRSTLLQELLSHWAPVVGKNCKSSITQPLIPFNMQVHYGQGTHD